ncbi:dipeptide/oligopeptide/nickel ABC transporter permease/ATP-binding protein [Arthrobacter sp. 18067]|uniref:dipeptide/oligopeptide/nickel ABC transporter permease/ATP-binding protein n=1 Tax=Arthrobacter sp. 18067 TaxID=2681413 RepID=UPI00135B91E2|nr:dipeptide/oligopeptide/nickel ABC transporter permease/ATP-binding protein [Arthrobacter sp. 18067]
MKSSKNTWSAVFTRPVGIVGLVLVFALVVIAVIGPFVWGEAATATNTGNINAPDSGEYLFGTDSLGRDIFARVMVATRLSLVLALVATLIGLVIGLVIGSARILFGPIGGRIADVIINVTNAFPSLLMILFFAAVFGVSTIGAVMALALSTAPTFARLTWTLTASVEKLEYVDAAKVSGVSRPKILMRHVLPNVAEALILNATLSAGTALLAFGGLSFLGIGIQPPEFDFGRLLNEGFSQFYVNPVAVLGPAAAVVLAGLGFNLLGEAIAHSVSQRGEGAAAPKRPAKRSAEVTRLLQAKRKDADVLVVEDLKVSFGARGASVTPVRGVDIRLGAGQRVGIVGESGSGKSLTALAIADLIEAPGRVDVARREFSGHELDQMPAAERDTLLGKSLSVVFQNPMTSFNPIRRIGPQLGDGIRRHMGASKEEAHRRAVRRLEEVGIKQAEERLQKYPFEFSGGMQQRAMIAMGTMGRPRLIIADEPTTALDVTTQSRVLRLLKDLSERENAALLLISHDIAVIGKITDRVLVMYAGKVIEDLPSEDLAAKSVHPYTRALLSALPDLDTDRDQPLTVIPGRAPAPAEIGKGCPFAPRCDFATDKCREQEPELLPAGPVHTAACWHPVSANQATLPPSRASLLPMIDNEEMIK